MKTRRKTIEVQAVVETVNRLLRGTDAGVKDLRRGAIFALEEILATTGTYRGFGYLRQDEVADGAPGVITLEGGGVHPDIIARFAGTDSTRRFYF